MDHQMEMAYGESNGHVNDTVESVAWPLKAKLWLQYVLGLIISIKAGVTGSFTMQVQSKMESSVSNLMNLRDPTSQGRPLFVINSRNNRFQLPRKHNWNFEKFRPCDDATVH